MALDGWDESTFTAGTRTFPVFRSGTGPGVVVVHEIPGITPLVEAFGREVVDAGFTVVMPSLFGTPGGPRNAGTIARSIGRVCISREFAVLSAGTTAPVADWVRALARSLHAELGGPGVGAVGMCLTGGFALAMMVDDAVVAPVLSQPSSPFAVTRRLGADLGLSPADLAVVQGRADCSVLGLRYTGDKVVGTRFDTLWVELGERFRALEYDGAKHSVLTEHRQDSAVEAVLAFFHERLDAPA